MSKDPYFTDAGKRVHQKPSKSVYKWKRKELLPTLTRIKDYLNETKSKKKVDAIASKCKARTCAKYRVRSYGVEPYSYTYLAMQLRRCLVSHDWAGAAKVMVPLLDGPTFLTPLLWRSCITILKNHPSSSKEFLNEFIMKSTGSTTTLLEQFFRFRDSKPTKARKKK